MSTRRAISDLIHPGLWIKIYDWEYNYPAFIRLSSVDRLNRNENHVYAIVGQEKICIENGFYSDKQVAAWLWGVE